MNQAQATIITACVTSLTCVGWLCWFTLQAILNELRRHR
jgi:hypothetical protein